MERRLGAERVAYGDRRHVGRGLRGQHPRKDLSGHASHRDATVPAIRKHSRYETRHTMMHAIFRRRPPPAEPPPAGPNEQRREVLTCFNCGRQAPPYVYIESGHDYCLTCARALYRELGFRPAGQRPDDITLEELLESE